MSFKGGNFSFQARTAQNWLRMVKYGTYLELNRSQDAPMHCPTFDSLTQCFASAHFRSPPVRLQFGSPPYSITDFSRAVKPYFLSELFSGKGRVTRERGGESLGERSEIGN